MNEKCQYKKENGFLGYYKKPKCSNYCLEDIESNYCVEHACSCCRKSPIESDGKKMCSPCNLVTTNLMIRIGELEKELVATQTSMIGDNDYYQPQEEEEDDNYQENEVNNNGKRREFSEEDDESESSRRGRKRSRTKSQGSNHEILSLVENTTLQNNDKVEEAAKYLAIFPSKKIKEKMRIKGITFVIYKKALAEKIKGLLLENNGHLLEKNEALDNFLDNYVNRINQNEGFKSAYKFGKKSLVIINEIRQQFEQQIMNETRSYQLVS